MEKFFLFFRRVLYIVLGAVGLVDLIMWLGWVFCLVLYMGEQDHNRGDFAPWWLELNSKYPELAIAAGVCALLFVFFIIHEENKKNKKEKIMKEFIDEIYLSEDEEKICEFIGDFISWRLKNRDEDMHLN